MYDMNTNPDPLALVHDDDLHQLINGLDRVHTGLTDLQAASVLDGEPALQNDLWSYARVIRAAADLLFQLREENHQ